MKHINYDKVLVEWVDIDGCEDAWNTEDELKQLLPATCTTIGYLYEDNPHFVKTFATFSHNNDGTIHFGDCVVFPKGCVVSIKKMEN